MNKYMYIIAIVYMNMLNLYVCTWICL